MSATITIDSPVGTLGISLGMEAIEAISFLPDDTATLTADYSHQALKPLTDYFQGYCDSDVQDYCPAGTPFQQRVWARLCRIPAGQTITYGELAHELGSSARAVAQACRRNPLPILIPCHRVLAADGLGGYAGELAEEGGIKHWLLEHERSCCR